MTEPFIDENGQPAEMDDQFARICLGIRKLTSISRQFTAAMDAMHALGRQLKELKGEDPNSLTAALKVLELNGQLIEEARRWLKEDESRP